MSPGRFSSSRKRKGSLAGDDVGRVGKRRANLRVGQPICPRHLGYIISGGDSSNNDFHRNPGAEDNRFSPLNGGIDLNEAFPFHPTSMRQLGWRGHG